MNSSLSKTANNKDTTLNIPTKKVEPFSRLLVLDFARAIAAFFLVVVHSLWMYGTDDVQFHSPLGHTVHAMGQMTAAFLLLMGASFILTRHQSLLYGVKRAIFILLAGYVLNIFKFIIPITVFKTMPESFIHAYGWESPLNVEQLRYLLLTGDILQMAGISFLVIAFVRHYVKNKNIILLLVGLTLLITHLLRGFKTGLTGLDYVLDLLWGTEWNVYFPVFPWIANILTGMYVAMHINEYENKHKALFDICLKLGAAFFVIGIGLCIYDWKYHFNDFFHPRSGGILYLIGVNLLVFCLLDKLIYTYLHNNIWFLKITRYLSQQITSIYFIQWVLVCWLMGIIGYKTLTTWQLIALFPFMILATLLIDYTIKWLIERYSVK